MQGASDALVVFGRVLDQRLECARQRIGVRIGQIHKTVVPTADDLKPLVDAVRPVALRIDPDFLHL